MAHHWQKFLPVREKERRSQCLRILVHSFVHTTPPDLLVFVAIISQCIRGDFSRWGLDAHCAQLHQQARHNNNYSLASHSETRHNMAVSTPLPLNQQKKGGGGCCPTLSKAGPP